MEQNPSWDTDSCSASQEIPCVFWNRRLITVTTAHVFLFNFFKIHINIIFPSMSSSSKLSSLQVSPPTTCMHISFSPHVKFSVVSPPKGTDHEFPQYAALSGLLLLRPSQTQTPLGTLFSNTLSV